MSGMSGEQFALPDAVDRLREVRRSGADETLMVITGADPLNLTGIVTPGDRIRAASGSRIVYRDGIPLAALEGDGITPHVPMPPTVIRGDGDTSAARRRARRRMTTRAYAISQRVRKRIEEMIGWVKTVGGLKRAGFIGRWKIKLQAEVTAAAYNLLRLARLAPVP